MTGAAPRLAANSGRADLEPELEGGGNSCTAR